MSSHAPSMLGWIALAILYSLYLADFIITVAVVQGLNKKLTKLDQLRSDMRIVSDKLSATLATKTIDTAQVVEKRRVQATLAKADFKDAAEQQRDKSLERLRQKKTELQRQFDALSNSITNHTAFGQGRLIRVFPGMKHRDYYELIQELKIKINFHRRNIQWNSLCFVINARKRQDAADVRKQVSVERSRMLPLCRICWFG